MADEFLAKSSFFQNLNYRFVFFGKSLEINKHGIIKIYKEIKRKVKLFCIFFAISGLIL